jgi:hypothetical protein
MRGFGHNLPENSFHVMVMFVLYGAITKTVYSSLFPVRMCNFNFIIIRQVSKRAGPAAVDDMWPSSIFEGLKCRRHDQRQLSFPHCFRRHLDFL